MNQALVNRVVNAVLYEGYILYPYRPSVKNHQRWTFGGIYPQSYSLAQGGSEAWTMQTECLVSGRTETILQVTVRFLHLVARQVGELAHPLTELLPDKEPEHRAVESLRAGGKLWQSWQEAVERDINLGDCELGQLVTQPQVRSFAFPPHRELEAIRGPAGDVVGIIVRDRQPVEGAVELCAYQCGDGMFKVRVRILNCTALEGASEKTRDEALLRSLVSTHTILGVRGGEFVSLLDPPEAWRETAAACRNEGSWPVLVGEPGEKDTMLSSPIILYDYPQVAPESPGDLFDATEIDEILTLRILTLTEEEKQAAASVDERARALLARTESLAQEQLLGLHGAVRGLRPIGAEDNRG